jgi:hypothetical protein
MSPCEVISSGISAHLVPISRDNLQIAPPAAKSTSEFHSSHKTAQGEVYTTLKRTRLLPTVTTSTFGAQRLFSSLSTPFQRSAARTATNNQSLFSCTVFLATSRTYAKKKMPPKKAAKEEKILLGRPGNNLKSGIVCCSAVNLCQILTIFRSVLPTWGNPHSSKLSPNVTLEILP